MAAQREGFFFLHWALGPIDLFGGRDQVGRSFIAVALPILGVASLYDPAVRWLDRRVYPGVYVAGGFTPPYS